MLYALSPAPPLTVENILKGLEGVKDWGAVAEWLGTHYYKFSNLKKAVERFLQGQGYFQPSWRAVIFLLDKAGETRVASSIRSYGEPVQGRCTYTKNTMSYTHGIPQHVYHHSSVAPYTYIPGADSGHQIGG